MLAADFFPPNYHRAAHPLQLYPSALAIYVTSLSAIAGGQEGIVAEMLKARGVRGFDRGRVLSLLAESGLQPFTQRPPDQNPLRVPVSEFLYDRCAPFARQLFHDEEEFNLAFDRLEYIATLYAEAEEQGPNRWIPGRWLWRAAQAKQRGEGDIRNLIGKEIDQSDENWPYLQAGLAGGSRQKLHELRSALDLKVQSEIDRT